MRLLLLTFLLTSSICCAQSDSISVQWNHCEIDTIVAADGNSSRIQIKQNKWSNSKDRIEIHFWTRVFYADGTMHSETTGTRYYKGDGYYQVSSIKKTFNASGRRISTERDNYKTPSFI